MNWYVQIKTRVNEGFSDTLTRKIYYNIDTKKEVLALIKEDFPEYFIEKVPQRTSKTEFFFATIFELPEDSEWYRFWTEEIPCYYCGSNAITKIEMRQYMFSGNYYCSNECMQKAQEDLADISDKWSSSGVVGYIYKITYKPDGRVYIGKTTNFPTWRWFQHLKADSTSPFHQFIKSKSSIEDWQFEVVEKVTKGTHQTLLEKESQYIAKYKATESEYGFNVRA